MIKAQTQELVEWAMLKIEKIDKEKKVYNLSALIFTILDIICGFIAIFYTSLLATSVVASIICGAIWGGRLVSLIKAERLAKALKLLTTASLAYIAARKKRSEYMKNFFKNIKNNPLTIVFALLGGGIMAFATYTIAQLYFISLPTYLYVIFAVIAAIVTMVLVVILGWDNVKSAILRSAKKNLSTDNYNKVIEFVGTLETAQEKDKQEQAENAKKLKDVEQAKAIVASYEAQVAEKDAQKVAYENAKKVLANAAPKPESKVVDEDTETE